MSHQTDTAYNYIKEKILSGEYKPAQKLTENQLAEEIGVSRNTVKKALLKLEQENLVTVETNKGASIKSFTLDEIKNYLEIREVLEGLVIRSVAKNINSNDLSQLQQILHKMAICLETNDFDKYSTLNKEFHSLIYKNATNIQAVEIINIIKTQLNRYHFRTVLVPGRNQSSYQEHQTIYRALAAHDEQVAENAIREHVANVRKTITQNYQFLL